MFGRILKLSDPGFFFLLGDFWITDWPAQIFCLILGLVLYVCFCRNLSSHLGYPALQGS